METRRNSQALITVYIAKLRIAFMNICKNESNNITQNEFGEAFVSVFNGLTNDTTAQIYNGFIQSLQSTYTIYNNTINYNILLNDDRLPRILIILHNFSISQITEFHRDIASKLLTHNKNNNNINDNAKFYQTEKLTLKNEYESDPNQHNLITALIQKLRYAFGEIANSSQINYDEFKQGFNSVFIGITMDIYKQIFDGFDISKKGKINYYEMLKDDKLPKILILLHENAITQISKLQTEKMERITNNNSNNNNNKNSMNGESPDTLNEKFNFFEIINNFKQEKQSLLHKIGTLNDELIELKKCSSKLNEMALEWRNKYECEIKQNKTYQVELETDLEEEFKTKLNQIVNEYEQKLSEDNEKYENMVNEHNVKYEQLFKEKEDEIEKQKQKYKQLLIFENEKEKQRNKHGMFGVIKTLFNSTDTDLTNTKNNDNNNLNNENEIYYAGPKPIGIVTLDVLNTFNADNIERKLISIYGVIFDVTYCNKYNKYGTYKEFTGHDITLCIIFNKYDIKWCDKFVQLNYKQIENVMQYIKGFKKEFVNVGKLKNYQEIQSNWPKLTESDLRELEDCDDCIVM